MDRTRRTFLKAASLAPLVYARRTAWAQSQEVVWWAPNWGQARAEELVRRFQAANPDLRVKIEITVADGLQNRVLTALRSGAPPDLIDINSGWTIPYGLTGDLLTIDDIVQQQKVDLTDFLPAPMATARVNGKLMGLPYRIEGHGFIYNRGAYREAGLDPDKPPRTWDELIEYSKRLTRRTSDGKQQYGLGVCGGGEVGNVIFRAMPQIWMNGGSVISEDLKRVVVNEAAAVQAVDFYTSPFTKHGIAPPSTLQNDGLAIRRLFIAGAVAQYQSGQFDIPPIRKENPALEIGVAKLPAPRGKDPGRRPRRVELHHPESREEPGRRRPAHGLPRPARQHGLLHRHLPCPPVADGDAPLPGPDPDGLPGDAPLRPAGAAGPGLAADGPDLLRPDPADPLEGSLPAGRDERSSQGHAAALGPRIERSSRVRRDAPPDAGSRARGKAVGALIQRNQGLVFALPALALMATLILYPLTYTGWLSVTADRGGFVGVENFTTMIEDSATALALRNTAVYVGFSVALQVSLGTAVGILLNQRFRGRAVVRSIVLIPWVVPGIVAATTWAWMFHTEFGIINYMLTQRASSRRRSDG